MNKKAQRIASIIIGLVLAVLLVYVGIRIVQQRGSQASEPINIQASRLDVDTCRVTVTTRSDEPALLRYGESALTFYHRMQPENIEPGPDGNYEQVADISNISAEQVTFIVENFEDTQAQCQPYTSSTGSSDSDTSLDEILPTSAPEPTSVPEPTESAPEEPSSVSKVGLDADTAEAYFNANSGATINECVDEFKQDYYGVVQVCNKASRTTAQ